MARGLSGEVRQTHWEPMVTTAASAGPFTRIGEGAGPPGRPTVARVADDYVWRVLRQFDEGHLRSRLMQAGLYLLAYELVRLAIVDEVKGFFCEEMDDDFRPVPSPEFINVVRGGGIKSEYDGCIEWLIQAGVLSESHRADIERLRDERHRVAHKPLGLIVDPDFGLDVDLLHRAAEVLERVGRFFGQVAVDADAAFDGVEVDPERIDSGLSLVYSHLLRVVNEQPHGQRST